MLANGASTRAPPLLQRLNSTSYATEMLKTVDRAAEKHVKHARTTSTSTFHSTKARLATGSTAEKPDAICQRHEGIEHEAAGATAPALSPNVSGSGCAAPCACAYACTPRACIKLFGAYAGTYSALLQQASRRQRGVRSGACVWH